MAIATSTAILGGAALIGGTSLLAGMTQAGAAEEAAGLQAEATRGAVGEQRRQYDITREDFAPWRETGAAALGEYGRLFGVGREGLISEDEMSAARDRFQTTPGYEFAFGEGMRALDRSASARGRLRGGGYGRELTRYGQGMASQEFGNYANRLAQIAGVGQAATGSTAQAGGQAAAGISGALMTGAARQGSAIQAAGTARASGYAGVGQAISGGVSNYMLAGAMQPEFQYTSR